MGAIRLAGHDNVATVLRAIAPGEAVTVRCGAEEVSVVASDAVPLCHKISLEPIGAGGEVVKYGQRIGLALEPIGVGRHVHVHNMRSARGRSEP
ncbi:MAG: UxaA family hydrolase [Rhodospirillales bacterium]|nr:UxaA family hydrolase [Rhodospirillales bacterium]